MSLIHTAIPAFALLLSILPRASGSSSTDWPDLDTAGTQSLRAGNFANALEEVLTDTMFSDTNLRLFKLGCAHAGLENHGKALFYFKKVAQDDSIWAPFAYEMIGDIEVANGRPENALHAYRAALDGVLRQRYQHHLYGKMYRIVTAHADSLGDIEWIEEVVGPPPQEYKVDLRDMLERYIETRAWPAVDSLVENLLDTSEYHQVHCDVASRLIQEPVPDSVLTTRSLFRLSKIAYLCQNYRASSDWLLEAISRRNFSHVVNNRPYMYHRAKLNYRLRNYNKAIRWLRKFEKKYTATPELVYLIARSYRSLGKGSQASQWYDKHITLYPNHARTHDILWYRAWQKEESGDNAAAREMYRQLYTDHPYRSKADDAFFRCGLSYIKDEKYSSALESFESFLKRYPDSRLHACVRYWKAKTQMLLDKTDDAREGFLEISRTEPIDYYGYRSREMLLLLGDSTEQFTIAPRYDEIAAARWLDSTSMGIREPLSSRDSLALLVGRNLSALGMAQHAEFYLEPLEVCYPGNLHLQFRLVNLYFQSGNPTRAFSIARRFPWRIPAESRSTMPLALYTQIFPAGFDNLVRPAAQEYGVEPELVYAIIRQESIFDPVIVSPAGAVGLMQIMPFTGEDIANALADSFAVDSLYNPAINVRYGSYYIHKLLKDFKGNFVLAIAGYNGGPHNVKKWYERNKHEGFDLFIEDLAFTETRGYVKKVLANYWTYKLIAQTLARVEG